MINYQKETIINWIIRVELNYTYSIIHIGWLGGKNIKSRRKKSALQSWQVWLGYLVHMWLQYYTTN